MSGLASLASHVAVRELLSEASRAVGGHKFSLHFLLTEWEQVVDAWQLETWESYRDVARLGRKTRLPEAQRTVLWSIFERVRGGLKERKLTTHAGLFTALASALIKSKRAPFDFAVVDESQDISVAHLRFFAALGAARPYALFLAGDLGQRIFQQPFSWKSLGVDIRGRSRNLRINYRTSYQIRQQADRLLGSVLPRRRKDVDHAAREHVLDFGCIGGHVRRGGMRFERCGVSPLFDEDEGVGAKLGLETAESFGVDGEVVLYAAVFCAYGRNVGFSRSQHGFTHARLGGDDGYDVDHQISPM